MARRSTTRRRAIARPTFLCRYGANRAENLVRIEDRSVALGVASGSLSVCPRLQGPNRTVAFHDLS